MLMSLSVDQLPSVPLTPLPLNSHPFPHHPNFPGSQSLWSLFLENLFLGKDPMLVLNCRMEVSHPDSSLSDISILSHIVNCVM